MTWLREKESVEVVERSKDRTINRGEDVDVLVRDSIARRRQASHGNIRGSDQTGRMQSFGTRRDRKCNTDHSRSYRSAHGKSVVYKFLHRGRCGDES